MVDIKGLEKFASRDFPGHISATIFTGGCNFRCPFCHNPDLVLRPGSMASVPQEEFLGFLDKRKGWLEGVCVTGGEPLMHTDLHENLSLIKKRGLLVKLDTNGSYPARLKSVLSKGLVDVVAMDVKAPLRKYHEAAGVDVKIDKIRRSIALIRDSGLEYYFRTTLVPGLIEEGDVRRIGQELRGCRRLVLQRFSPENTLDPAYTRRRPYQDHRMREMADLLRPDIEDVILEGF